MNKNELLRRLPKIDEIMKEESLVVLSVEKGSLLVTDAVRQVISNMRQNILDLDESDMAKFDAAQNSGAAGQAALEEFFRQFDTATVAAAAAAQLAQDEEFNLYPVINATGTILHTNLGRAPLCADAVENVARVSRGYSDLEYNVVKGARGSRHDLVSVLIAELTGAEDAMVVNNNASATMIVLAALGEGKEIIVSRGELVEIGGAFRIPDIMAQSGAFLTEVGTSNKTKPSDYEKAIVTSDAAAEELSKRDIRGTKRFQTGALMKVHKSNYDILGFTEEASLDDLVTLGKKYDLPVIFDMGNGLMLDMSEYGLREPNIPASLATGIDVMLFSGDKLLGGPQAGIIVGKKKYISRMKKHPLARAMRVDKMTFAALEATLAKYKDPAIALRDIPVLNMIAGSSEDMRAKAQRLADVISKEVPDLSLELTEVEDQIGGGSAPMVRLPGWAVAVSDGSKSADSLERRLRKAEVPVIARIHDDRLLLCVRTIFEDEFGLVAKALGHRG
ncbi:MAG: L-seryl-tRNA(Sec) selenium transferase [Mogibacterium sp.]|nr:L-seryl-tRNA(Sec) selenium transferase [Mogibacterium sp.]